MRHARCSPTRLRRALASRLITLWVVLLWTVARAGDGPGPLAGGPPAPALPDPGWALLRVLAALALVLGLFALAVWLFRNGQRVLARGRTPKLRILEVRPLGGRQSLYVVAYERERFLLAASPQGLQLLTHLPPLAPEAAEAVEMPVSVSPAWSGVFATVLRQARSRGP